MGWLESGVGQWCIAFIQQGQMAHYCLLQAVPLLIIGIICFQLFVQQPGLSLNIDIAVPIFYAHTHTHTHTHTHRHTFAHTVREASSETVKKAIVFLHCRCLTCWTLHTRLSNSSYWCVSSIKRLVCEHLFVTEGRSVNEQNSCASDLLPREIIKTKCQRTEAGKVENQSWTRLDGGRERVRTRRGRGWKTPDGKCR